MATFTAEEKTQIMSSFLDNQDDEKPMENKKKWQQLGLEINRDCQEIKDAFYQWKSEEKACNQISQCQSDYEEVLQNDSYVIASVQHFEDYQCFSSSVMEHTQEFYTNMIQSIASIDNHDRESKIQSKDYSANIQSRNDQHCKQFELNYIDEVQKDILERKSREELQMKREEHKKVMEIYEKHLQYGEEIHKECMNLLKTKLQSAKRQLHDIDDVIFTKNLKRFKSGPI